MLSRLSEFRELLLRQLGVAPPVTGLIFFYRRG
jgi:hypothetical protein